MRDGLDLRTARLRLRAWRDSDRIAFASMNADPAVMDLSGGAVSREESDATVRRLRAHFAAHGFGIWAVEVPGEHRFVGCVGLMRTRFHAPFTPCVEVSWRLAREHWGQGYATEAARAALAFGFDDAGLDEIVSFTVPHNRRSRRVMEKLGMTRDPREDFEHPTLPRGHPLRRHVLYRIRKSTVPGDDPYDDR
jgi:RimJ/RimL family protein N-acetyltransferase